MAGELDEELWGMESDLPSLGNQAAIELDNQILGRGTDFQAVKRLVARLASDGVLETATSALPAQYDPVTIGVVSRAIGELIRDPGKRPKQISQRMQVASQKTEELRKVADDPGSFTLENLAELREYCLALSESASVAVDDKAHHRSDHFCND